jgi:hypothetical protein
MMFRKCELTVEPEVDYRVTGKEKGREGKGDAAQEGKGDVEGKGKEKGTQLIEFDATVVKIRSCLDDHEFARRRLVFICSIERWLG